MQKVISILHIYKYNSVAWVGHFTCHFHSHINIMLIRYRDMNFFLNDFN